MKRLFRYGVGNPGFRAAAAIVLSGVLAFGATGASARAENTGHFEKHDSDECESDACTIVFGRVADQHRLLVENISCFLFQQGRLQMIDAGLYASGGHYQATTPVRTVPTGNEVYALNQRVHFYVNAGRKVSVRFRGDPEDPGHAFLHAYCKIVGEVERLD